MGYLTKRRGASKKEMDREKSLKSYKKRKTKIESSK